jgi:nitrate reductase gamma subunit
MKPSLALLTILVVGALGWLAASVETLRPVLAWAALFAAVVFLVGVPIRVLQWLRTPVPFRITTTCGQQKSLSWIRASKLESPATALGAFGRMALEVLLFRSLFRNTAPSLRPGPRLTFGERKFLWLGAIAFHYSLLVVIVRHLRFFFEPTPGVSTLAASVDGFFQVGEPVLYATDAVILAALGYLALRRLLDARLRYLSMFSDYFAVWLLLAIAGTGVWMRYIARTDVVSAKTFGLGLVTLSPVVPAGATPLFLVHVALVATLLAYFPLSKLVHMAGVFLSPTRNLPNDNRRVRHVNPWDYPVKVHKYEEWEEEFHDKIQAAGLPMEKPAGVPLATPAGLPVEKV